MNFHDFVKCEIDQLDELDLAQVYQLIEQLNSKKVAQKPKRYLPSHAALRASQLPAKTSSLEILQRLRDEARY